MKVFYDYDCKFCNKLKDFYMKNSDKNLIFLPIKDSLYHEYTKETIVVINSKNSEIDSKHFVYGEAIKLIINDMYYPYKLFSFLPISVLKIIYIFLREVRRYV